MEREGADTCAAGGAALARWRSGAPGDPDLGGVRSAHVGQLLCVRGTVLRTSAVQMLEILRTYICKKCKKRCWDCRVPVQ